MKKILWLFVAVSTAACSLIDNDPTGVSRRDVHPDAVNARFADVEGVWRISYFTESCKDLSSVVADVTLTFTAAALVEARFNGQLIGAGKWELRKGGRILAIDFEDDDLPDFLDDLDVLDANWSVMEASASSLNLLDWDEDDDDEDDDDDKCCHTEWRLIRIN